MQIDTPVDPRLRWWVLCGRALTVVFLLFVVFGAIVGWPFPVIIVLALAIGMTGSWLLDPRRQWWGPEPAAILAEPERRKAWARRELLVGLALFVVISLVLPAGLAAVSVLTD
jgi:hypothetical protein